MSNPSAPIDVSAPVQYSKRLRRVTAAAVKPEPIGPAPLWVQRFQSYLGAHAKGYALAVVYTDSAGVSTVFTGAANFARSPFEVTSEGTPWAPATRCNLASVSKFITAVAATKLLSTTSASWLEQPFWPLIEDRFPSDFPLGAGVGEVTLGRLLTMSSGLEIDQSLIFPDVWTFLSDYLTKPVTGISGYSNTNFTILQAVIENQSGQGYVDYVSGQVLDPMGIDTAVFNDVPDQEAMATLAYYGAPDCRPGQYFRPFQAIAAGGWLASAEQLIKFMTGLRGSAALTPDQLQQMLTGYLGCYPWEGAFGTYYHHNGGLALGAAPVAEIRTGVMRFTDGWDAVLLINSAVDIDPIPLLAEAFDAGAQGGLQPVFRYYNESVGAHFYTVDDPPGLADSWNFEGVRFYALGSRQPGTAPVSRYVNSINPDLYYYKVQGGSVPGWIEQGTAFYTMQPMGCAPTPGTATLNEYRLASNQDVYFYTSNPAEENLDGYELIGDIGYVYDASATPVYRYLVLVDGCPVHFYTTNPSREKLASWTAEGIKFYAFATDSPGTVPLFRYVSTSNKYFHWYSPVRINSSRWVAEKTNIYVYPSQVPGSQPLIEYTLDAAPKLVQFLTSNPSQEILYGFSETGVIGYVLNPQWIR